MFWRMAVPTTAPDDSGELEGTKYSVHHVYLMHFVVVKLKVDVVGLGMTNVLSATVP